jgi:hypothetical protein
VLQPGLVLDQAGEPPKHRDVRVGLGGDGDHEMGHLPVVPEHPLRHLQHGEPAPADQVPVLDHAMRDDDAVPEIGVRHGFPPQHALAVGGIDAAGGHQKLRRLANRGLFGGGPGGAAHEDAGGE